MKVLVNGIELNYIVSEGQGHPLILLHGNGEDHSIFKELMDSLNSDYTIYALDSRNHGLSSKTSDFSYEVMKDDVLCFIKTLKIEKPTIIGFSDGAIIALLIALEDQSLLDKLVLMGVNLNPTDFKDENLLWLEEMYAKTQDPLFKLMLEEPNIELESLASIRNKTLLICGEDDLFKEQMFEDICNVIPNASLLIMQGHDHSSYIINKDILSKDLKDFIH